MLLRIFTEPQQGASYDALVAVAKASEDLGFDAFFRSDHYLRMGDGDGLPGPTDAWVTLAGIARETNRIRLGTLVTSATFRLPGPLATTVGSEFNLAFCPLEVTGDQFERVRAACEVAGRDPGSLVLSAAQAVCCGRDEVEIAGRAAAIGREVAELREHGLCGTPDEVLSKLAAYTALGAERIYLQILDVADLDHLALIGEAVLPHCAAL